MQVLKFGGTSVANAKNIARVAEIVANAVEKDRSIVVCSAISGFTDALIKTGHLAAAGKQEFSEIVEDYRIRHTDIIRDVLPYEKQKETIEQCNSIFESLSGILQGVFLLGELSRASLDAIQGCGELLSTRILAARLASTGIATKWVDSREIIKTSPDGQETDTATTFANISRMLETNPAISLFILPGFIASDSQGRTTTLGRGGSDYSASLIAVGCNARILEIWTDVPGMMTANPKIVPTARTISNISYRAALELSHFGAKVIYPPTIQPVVSEGIPIYVKNTFSPEESGTLIEKNPPRSKEKIIGISNSDNIALVSLEGSGMVGIPGFSSRLFGALAHSGINIILITQASSVHTMCLAISEKDADKAKAAADKCFAYEISLGKLNPLKVEKGYSIVCIVGDDILNQCGTTGRMLAALGRNGISIRATAQGSSERNISIIVKSQNAHSAIRYIHDEFFDTPQYKELNLFIAGYGNVGKALIEILSEHSPAILRRTGKKLRIAGISNSRRYVIDTGGIPPHEIGKVLENGTSASDEAYFNALSGLSLENSVFVDCTASPDAACKYIPLAEKGYSIVSCNKILFSAPISRYKALKKTAAESGITLKYGTTVGAALPVLESVSRCVNAGDEIHTVEAVLSGTLNYIFSTYDGGKTISFADTVRKAQASGYSEPDPRIDLSCRDVLRKLVILAREAGIDIDEQDVETVPILGNEFFEGDVESFFRKLEENEDTFATEFQAAADAGKKRRIVASLIRDCNTRTGYSARISATGISPDHPLYNLEGTDNCAIIKTEFYPSPLIIRGAGAGAKQTASGILDDILQA